MLRSVWRGVVVVLKGVGVLIAILAGLLLVAVIWFSLNPPFRSPETGELRASATRELRLTTGQAALAIGLDVRLNLSALRSSGGAAGPPTLRASIASMDGGTLDGVQLRLAPEDASVALSEVRESGDGRLDWTMTCADGTAAGCRQRLVLLFQAAPSATERRWRLSVDGDLRYPAFVPVPGGSSFDLNLRSVGPETGTGPSPLAETSGTVDLAMDRPVVVVPIHVDRGGAPRSGGGSPSAVLRLAIDAVRLTETGPAGLDAPEPVRATVLSTEGTLLARQGVRPGQGGRVLGLALADCSSDCASEYWVAFEWMDRQPQADYRLTWRAEVIGLPGDDRSPDQVAIRADAPRAPDLAGMVLAPAPNGNPLRAQRLDVAIGGLPLNDPARSPIHAQLLITAKVDSADAVGTTVARIQPGSLDMPFDVIPGQTGSMVVNLEEGCAGGRCDTWWLQAITESRNGVGAGAQLLVTWQLDVRAWQLVPDATPINLSLDVR